MTTPRRALIVIDVQNEYVSGDLPIEYPDIHSSLANIGMLVGLLGTIIALIHAFATVSQANPAEKAALPPVAAITHAFTGTGTMSIGVEVDGDGAVESPANDDAGD